MREYAKTIYESSESLLNTINDLIYISRIETGEIRILEEEVDLNSLFSELYVTFESMAKRKGLEMGFEIDLPMEQRKIVVDEEKLKQVLKNLISNAVKFTKAGSVRFGCRVEEDDICFYVKDTGIGISPESRERIFERFRQGEEGTARKYQGAGLGLSIAKAFAEYLGGEIRFESEPEQGSTFFFIIPYKIRSHSEETREAISGYDWKGKTLLIVEDDAINYLFLREAVNSTGVRVLYARNGEEAVSQCREHPEIDVILMDLKMPRMDGYEATRLIRDFRENLPIIAQTAYAMPEEKKKIRVSGFDDYLIKPIDPENLLEKVAEYI
jgi:CheY-like chemotaxis protein/anti-sigma regulatory factor (Ser/Thr protein kinase)